MAQNINCGDKFVRLESPEIIWNVVRIVELPGLPQHAEIVSYGVSTKTMLLSEKALLDHRMWKIYAGKAA
jgi:hypothetical protein